MLRLSSLSPALVLRVPSSPVIVHLQLWVGSGGALPILVHCPRVITYLVSVEDSVLKASEGLIFRLEGFLCVEFISI